MDREETLAKVLDVVNETLEVPEGTELAEDTNFKDLGADSFDLLELVTALEDEFDLTFDDEALEKIVTVRDAVDGIMAAR